MQPSNADQESRSNHFEWYLLGEYAPSHFLPDPEKSDSFPPGRLAQTVQELGIPVRCVENVELTLRSLAREAPAYFKLGRGESPGRIRIFCQKKRTDEEMKGGWGYFVIERSRDSSTSDCTEPHQFIDLYFYQEGE